MYTLRPYQSDAVESVYRHLREKDTNPCVVIPTAGGKSLCKAVGVVNLTDTAQLHNLPLMITVGVDRNDPTRNVIRAYKAKAGNGGQGTGNGGSTASVPKTASGAAPWAR